MLKMKSIKRSLGIGLLELMLSLAIIAVLLIMATRYYSSASNSQKVTSAVQMITAVKAALGSYLAGQPTSYTTPPTISQLVKSGLLPESFGTASQASPWGTAIGVGTIGATTFTVTMTFPQNDMCLTVANQLNASSAAVTGKDVAEQCSSGAGTFTFYRAG